MNFAIIFSTLTMKSAVHAPACRCASKRRGQVVVEYEAATPRAAADAFRADEDADAREFPPTTVAACAKGGR